MKTNPFQIGQTVKVITPTINLPMGKYSVERVSEQYVSLQGVKGIWWPSRFEAVVATFAPTFTPQVAPKRRQVLIRGAKGRFVSPTISKLRNGSIYQTSQGVGRLLGVVGKKNRLAVVVTKDGTKTVQPAELSKVSKEVVREFLAVKG